MIDGIVFSSVGFLAIFFAAWALHPGLRAWIERPKYRFQSNVQSYDQEQRAAGHQARARRTDG